jgi:predicted dinucleotide-binding enzyme
MTANGAMKQDRRGFLELAGLASAALALGGLPPAAPAAGAGPEKLKIGVVGSGRVGGALGGVWVKAGHDVMFSSRDLEHNKKLAAGLGPNARAGTPREAAAFGEVLLISVPYRALPDVGKDLGALVSGKVVIDTCNPIPSRDGDIATWARDKGAGLASAELLPGARIVRAFNAISSARMGAAHEQKGERIGMPIAGDDPGAIEVASRLIREIGYEPVLIGGLAMGKHLMPGTPLAGERTPDQIRQIAATLR